MSPVTKAQWKSVLLNSIFAFLAAFTPVIIASENIDKATLVAAATAGLMAILKIIEKLNIQG